MSRGEEITECGIPRIGEDENGGEEKVEPRPRCFCGIEIARANEMCPERDCPYARVRS